MEYHDESTVEQPSQTAVYERHSRAFRLTQAGNWGENEETLAAYDEKRVGRTCRGE